MIKQIVIRKRKKRSLKNHIQYLVIFNAARIFRVKMFPENRTLAFDLKYFINRHGIDPSRLSINGYADQKPLALNDTSENRAQNRRVEIRLKEKQS